MFKLLYGTYYSLWRHEHLKIILDDVLNKGNLDVAKYFLSSPRTLVLYEYHTYFDKMLLIGHMITLIKTQASLKELESTLATIKPFTAPLIFH